MRCIVLDPSGLLWHSSEHVGIAMEAFATIASQRPCKRRRSQQCWLTLLSYIDDEMWVFLQGQSTSTAKLATIIGFALRTGLRLPSEHSLKRLCSLWLVTSEDADGLRNMSADTKVAMMRHVRK